MRKWMKLCESATEDPRTVLLLVRANAQVEQFEMSFRDFLKQNNLENISPLLDQGSVWCNIGITGSSPFINVYWRNASLNQMSALQHAIIKLGISPSAKCDVTCSADRLVTRVEKLPEFFLELKQKEKLATIKAKRKPSKQFIAASEMNIEILNDDLTDTSFSRVVWEKQSTITTNDLELVGLSHYPGVYGIHVGDVDFWFNKLIDDYGNDDHAWEINIKPAKGDVLVEDVQYAIPDESGFKADSGILLTSRRLLREGRDFHYVREMSIDE